MRGGWLASSWPTSSTIDLLVVLATPFISKPEYSGCTRMALFMCFEINSPWIEFQGTIKFESVPMGGRELLGITPRLIVLISPCCISFNLEEHAIGFKKWLQYL